MADLQALSDAIIKADRNSLPEALRLTREALAAGVDRRAIADAMVKAMDEVGRRFQCNQLFVPELLIAKRAMERSLELLGDTGVKPLLTAVIGTVQGDLHDIGKNLVAGMWKCANFKVIDLGTNVPPEKFAQAAKENNADIVGLSALLTTTMPAMKTTIEALRKEGLNNVKVIIGGAPITQEYADQIGATGFAPDAASAVTAVRKMMNL